jgi:hypothetical protein
MDPCSVQGPVTTYSDPVNKLLESAKCGKFLEYLSHYQLLKKRLCSMFLLSKKNEVQNLYFVKGVAA